MGTLWTQFNKFLCRTALTVVLSAALGSAVAGDTDSTKLTVSEIVEAYLSVVLSDEVYGDRDALRKWRATTEPLIVTVPSDSMFDSDEHYRNAINTIAEVATALAVPIGPGHFRALDADEMLRVVQTGELNSIGPEVNLITVYVGNREELAEWNAIIARAYPPATRTHEGFLRGSERTGVALCYGITLPGSIDRPNEIGYAWLFFEDTNKLADCASEDLMQVFGLFNDLPKGSPSMFNDDMVYSRPTELDWLLWRAHFDDRLKAGMSEKELRPLVERVVAELVQQ